MTTHDKIRLGLAILQFVLCLASMVISWKLWRSLKKLREIEEVRKKLNQRPPP
jgi:hypothetical protein